MMIECLRQWQISLIMCILCHYLKKNCHDKINDNINNI
jgi:hypothetical protein